MHIITFGKNMSSAAAKLFSESLAIDVKFVKAM